MRNQITIQVLKDRERRKKEADIEAERQAKIKELDAVVARLVKQVLEGFRDEVCPEVILWYTIGNKDYICLRMVARAALEAGKGSRRSSGTWPWVSRGRKLSSGEAC